MFDKQLNELAARHLTRRLTPLHSGVAPVVEMAGRQILLLASNDYLGLAMHPEVISPPSRRHNGLAPEPELLG